MKKFLKKLWFLAKDNTDWIFYKSYSIANNICLIIYSYLNDKKF